MAIGYRTVDEALIISGHVAHTPYAVEFLDGSFAALADYADGDPVMLAVVPGFKVLDVLPIKDKLRYFSTAAVSRSA